MPSKLLSRMEFSKLAGVTPSAVTSLCHTSLKNAVRGKRVDIGHPDAVAYLDNKVAIKGLDVLYESAVESCIKSESFSTAFIRREFKVGYSRAARIMDAMRLLKVIPEGMDPAPRSVSAPVKPPPEPVAAPIKRVPTYVSGAKAARETKKKASTVETSFLAIPENIQEFADMSLREIIEKFGTDTAFIDWLKSVQMIEMINEKRLKNATTEGALVSRDLVRVGIIEPIDACHIKLLTDGAKTIARRATAMHSAERPLDEIEKFVADQLTSFIRPVKAKVARAFKRA